MEKIAFVDKEFHRKTRSGDFLRQIFINEFEVIDFWHDDTVKCAYELINELINFKIIFFFQTILPYNHMVRLRNNGVNVIWAPMYDELPMGNLFWRRIQTLNLNILIFSNVLVERAVKYNINYFFAPYFIKPVESKLDLSKGLRVFFWYRGSLKLKDWINTIDQNTLIDEIIYYSSPDPRFQHEEIELDFLSKYKITIIKKEFINRTRNEFLNYLNWCNVFICPRKQEGIGLTIVEAISYGKCLIGYDDNTMNEYIINNFNGILINKSKIKIDTEFVKKSNKFCLEYANIGYNNWLNATNQIFNLFNNSYKLKKKDPFTFIFLTQSILVSFIRKLKSYK